MILQTDAPWWSNEWILASLVLLISIVIAILVKFGIKRTLKQLQKFEKTRVEESNIKQIASIVFWIIVVIGIYFALGLLSVVQNYLFYRDLLFYFTIAFLIGKSIAQLSKYIIIRTIRDNDALKGSAKTIEHIINFVIFAIVVLIVLSKLNIDITPLIATLGITGIAIGLAVQAPLANFFAGLFILSSRPMKEGDYIELDGNIAGYVEDIGWVSTKLRTLSNTIIIIPNSRITNTNVINHTRLVPEKWVSVEVSIDYKEDPDHIEQITLEIAKTIRDRMDECVKQKDPLVRYQNLGETTVTLRILIQVKKIDYQAIVTHELIKAIMKGFQDRKIDLSAPIRRIELIKDE
jgi:small-conductance mechanosensitive channel